MNKLQNGRDVEQQWSYVILLDAIILVETVQEVDVERITGRLGFSPNMNGVDNWDLYNRKLSGHFLILTSWESGQLGIDFEQKVQTTNEIKCVRILGSNGL